MKQKSKYIPTAGLSREAWLDVRRPYLGASQVGAVLGLSDYDTPYDVYAEKVLGVERVFTPEQEEAMESGLAMEPVVSAWVAKTLGARVCKDNKFRICTEPSYGFLGCSIDRIATLPDGRRVIIEIKTVSGFAFNNWDAEVPKAYYAQVQMQMFISGIHEAKFAVQVDGRKKHLVDVPYDAEFLDLALPKLRTFWEEHIVKMVEPPMDARRYALATVSESMPAVQEDVVELCGQAKKYRDAIAKLEEAKESVDRQIMAVIGDNAGIIFNGDVIATWRRDKDGARFDAKRFKVENEDLYNTYCVPTKGSRKLIIK